MGKLTTILSSSNYLTIIYQAFILFTKTNQLTTMMRSLILLTMIIAVFSSIENKDHTVLPVIIDDTVDTCPTEIQAEIQVKTDDIKNDINDLEKLSSGKISLDTQESTEIAIQQKRNAIKEKYMAIQQKCTTVKEYIKQHPTACLVTGVIVGCLIFDAAVGYGLYEFMQWYKRT